LERIGSQNFTKEGMFVIEFRVQGSDRERAG